MGGFRTAHMGSKSLMLKERMNNDSFLTGDYKDIQYYFFEAV